MNLTIRQPLTRTLLAGSLSIGIALGVAACGDSDSTDAQNAGDTTADTAGSTDAISATDPWVKATDESMTSAFGTIVNNTDEEITVVGASSDVAGTVELHEVTDGVMQPKEGGFTVPANGTHDLVAGGDHIMLMDLTGPLEAGQEVVITLELNDGSTQDISALVKPYAGADESYAGGAEGSATTDEHSDHG